MKKMYSSWVLILSLLLYDWTLAQETNITVDINRFAGTDVNSKLLLTVPRVSIIIFEAQINLVTTSQSEETCEPNGSMPQRTCILRLSQGQTTYNLLLENAFQEMTQLKLKINLTVNENYQVGCSMHVFPVLLNTQDRTGRFDCEPVLVDPNMDVSTIVWWRADTIDGINATVVDPRDRRVEIGGRNTSISFPQADTEDAAYYFPLVNDLNISQAAPVLVSYEPRITSNELPFNREFSRDLYIAPGVPQNTTFFCEVQSFTRPSIVWRFARTPGGAEDNMTIVCPDTTSSMCSPDSSAITNVVASREDMTDRVMFTLEIVNVGYENSGIYSCFPETEEFRANLICRNTDPNPDCNAHSFRLRVKDHLRPLWPAVGTIGVVLSMVVIISVGALWDHFYTKPRRDRERERHGSGHRPFSVTSTSSGSPDGEVPGIRLTEGHSALRRLSSAKVQLLEEPEN